MDVRRQLACRQIIELLDKGQRVMDMNLHLHSRILQYALPLKWRSHVERPCLDFKKTREGDCIHFARVELPIMLQHTPEGAVHQCPAGFTEISTAILVDGLPDGILFGGTYFQGPGADAPRGLTPLPSTDWMQDRLCLLHAMAAEAGVILSQVSSPEARTRRAEILAALRQPGGVLFELQDLAKTINLSPSRTGHVIREIFSTTFPKLLLSIRIDEGCRLLAQTERTLSAIAHGLGFSSQSHFTSCFREQVGIPPGTYRKQVFRGKTSTI
jgi:AraC-like DNA-binding protein